MTAAARIAVERRGEDTLIAELASRAPVGLRPLPPLGALARVALVQTSACLVSGDDVAMDVRVGRGASLEVIELSATLAHPVPADRPPIRQVVRVDVSAGGQLLWLAQPLVLASRTRMDRRLDVATAAGSRALLGETVVFGRDGEPTRRRDHATADHARRPRRQWTTPSRPRTEPSCALP
ncbi:MAG: urease accessory protein UreD [Solirubrobacteraceae bacterium]